MNNSDWYQYWPSLGHKEATDGPPPRTEWKGRGRGRLRGQQDGKPMPFSMMGANWAVNVDPTFFNEKLAFDATDREVQALPAAQRFTGVKGAQRIKFEEMASKEWFKVGDLLVFEVMVNLPIPLLPRMTKSVAVIEEVVVEYDAANRVKSTKVAIRGTWAADPVHVTGPMQIVKEMVARDRELKGADKVKTPWSKIMLVRWGKCLGTLRDVRERYYADKKAEQRALRGIRKRKRGP
ncbi:hypothetical protein MMC13_001403 [Lambiella insularis]|nr:hypothetical protein [Lambiella insularis]